MYLALEGIYLPLRTILPNSPTLEFINTIEPIKKTYGAITLCGATFQLTW